MKITRVILSTESCGCLTECSVIFDDCLKLNYIRLFKKDSYYLVLPSKQDLESEILKLLSKKYLIKLKEGFEEENTNGKEKAYEEFFYPLDKQFYLNMLNTVVYCYKEHKNSGKTVFRFY